MSSYAGERLPSYYSTSCNPVLRTEIVGLHSSQPPAPRISNSHEQWNADCQSSPCWSLIKSPRRIDKMWICPRSTQNLNPPRVNRDTPPPRGLTKCESTPDQHKCWSLSPWKIDKIRPRSTQKLPSHFEHAFDTVPNVRFFNTVYKCNLVLGHLHVVLSKKLCTYITHGTMVYCFHVIFTSVAGVHKCLFSLVVKFVKKCHGRQFGSSQWREFVMLFSGHSKEGISAIQKFTRLNRIWILNLWKGGCDLSSM